MNVLFSVVEEFASVVDRGPLDCTDALVWRQSNESTHCLLECMIVLYWV